MDAREKKERYPKEIVKCRNMLWKATGLFDEYTNLQMKHSELEEEIEKSRLPKKRRALIMQRTHLQDQIREVKEAMELSFQTFAVCETEESDLLQWTEEDKKIATEYVNAMVKKWIGIGE